MRLGYVVSRFPHVSETFILRELEALAEDPRLEIELMSLFPAVSSTVHPAAAPWVERLHRPGASEGALALLWWALRRPLRLAAVAGATIRGYARRPRMLARALATLPLAAAHARLVRRGSLEHVHAHYATWPALSAWVCHRLAGVPYSFTVHAHDIFVDQSFLGRRVEDAAYVVAISEYNRRFLANHRGEATRVEVVHCGIEPDRYRYRPRCPSSSGPVRALCVASLQEYKGHVDLLRAMSGSAALERLSLDLVGDGELRESLASEAGRLGLADRVVFHGSLPEARVTELLDEADLFVLPSTVAGDGQMEGIPVALMEALACGLCTVATRLSGIPELIRDGETGLLAEPGNPESLRAVLEAALAGACEGLDPAAARQAVEGEFDISRSAAALAELLLAGRPGQEPASTSS
jgi:colanic acid/amylovoran biosynthesis glycosyltransferase